MDVPQISNFTLTTKKLQHFDKTTDHPSFEVSIGVSATVSVLMDSSDRGRLAGVLESCITVTVAEISPTSFLDRHVNHCDIQNFRFCHVAVYEEVALSAAGL